MTKLVYSKDKEYHIHLKEGDVGKYVILPGDPGRCEKIAAYLENAQFVAQNREYTTYTGYLCGEKVSVVSTGIGGPSAAIALEELVHIGSDTFLRVGTSGGMREDVLGGDLVVATAAIRQEGTSREYAPIEYPAAGDFECVNALYNAAQSLGYRVHAGVVQSKDSFYGEHSPESMPTEGKLLYDWNAWLKCGALTSEMETAALYTVGAVRRVRVGAVLMVMGNQTRRALGYEDNIHYDTDGAIKTAVEAMKLLIAKDKEK